MRKMELSGRPYFKGSNHTCITSLERFRESQFRKQGAVGDAGASAAAAAAASGEVVSGGSASALPHRAASVEAGPAEDSLVLAQQCPAPAVTGQRGARRRHRSQQPPPPGAEATTTAAAAAAMTKRARSSALPRKEPSASSGESSRTAGRVDYG